MMPMLRVRAICVAKSTLANSCLVAVPAVISEPKTFRQHHCCHVLQLSSAQHHRLRSLRTKSDKTDCFNRFLRSSKLDLEAIVCECAVRFRHAVRILATLNGGAGVVRRVDQLARELLFHRLAVA